MQAFLIGLGFVALLLFIGVVDEKVSASRRKRKDALAAARRSSIQRREAENSPRGLKVIPAAAPVVERFTIPPSSSPPPFFDTPFADASVSCDSGGCDGGGGGCD